MPSTKKSRNKDTLDKGVVEGVEVVGRSVMEEQELQETPEEASFRNKETLNTALVLLFFSVLMFTLPFAAFFGVRHYLGVHMDVYGFNNTCWSVLSAVLTANIIVVAYVYVAYRDNQAEMARNKEKAN